MAEFAAGNQEWAVVHSARTTSSVSAPAAAEASASN